MKCKAYNAPCRRGCTDKCEIKERKLYQPSNGTEGCGFTSEFCDHCIHDNPDPESNKKCDILTSTMLYSILDKEYPHEWRYDALGHPTCTKYVNWNWDQNGDPDDPDNPFKRPDPPDPAQLHLFPLDGKEFEEKEIEAPMMGMSY